MALEDTRKETKSFLVLAVLGLFLIHPLVADSEWYSGGTLHRATVGEWRSASYRDKLATAADWALAHDRVKSEVMGSGSMQTLKPFAIDLVACVDGAAGPSGNDGLRVSRLAASGQSHLNLRALRAAIWQFATHDAKNLYPKI